MPIPLIAEGLTHGLSAIPYSYTVLKIAPWVLLVYLLKRYFGGANNTSERMMHSKVIMVTGGTAGIGAAIVRELAERGAQIVLLTHHPPSDPFLVEYVEDLRTQTSNELIYAEQVDLASLHSIRLFATKWVDNAPPRRLDMIILCANTFRPPYSKKIEYTVDGVEATWGVNYLANFHLLSILSPALRAQPPDRDVRVILAACTSYIGADLVSSDEEFKNKNLSNTGVYAASKLALIMFAQNFQRHLDAYTRPDKKPNNARVVVVNPGWTRTPGTRRWLSAGSLWGLLLYVLCWPFWWLFLKSPEQGAQSFLHAAMAVEWIQGGPNGDKIVKECRAVDYARQDVFDEKLGKKLWGASEKRIEALEKEGAIRRAREKKQKEKDDKKGKSGEGQEKEKKDSKKGSTQTASRPAR
ncbi:MAG: hypothetical protein M1823_001924 [Watsoniomyces obsoletus]|nr:MAG: hypothetical protein M1823_001924 [Watsoniomyces obsoletus]